MIQLLKIELFRLMSEIKAYKLDNIVGIGDVVLLCTGLLIGTGQNLFPDQSMVYALIGVILWRTTVVCLQTSCGMIQKELRLGTLEQLFLSCYHFLEILFIRLIAKLIVEGGKLAFACFILSIVFKIDFSEKINWTKITFAVLISLIGSIGMSFLVASVALIYKKAMALVNSVNYFMLFFTGVLIPLEALPAFFTPVANLFPFVWAVRFIQNTHEVYSVIALTFTLIVWGLIGVEIFFFCYRKALSEGTAGQY